MNDNHFKNTLIKALEQKANTDVNFDTDEIWAIIMALPQCNVYLEETSLYSYEEWNTYCTILHVQAPIEKQSVFMSQTDKILQIAKKMYGRQGDNILTGVDIGILVETYEVIDFSTISLTDVIGKAISDAELLMRQDYRILIDGGYADTYDKYLRQKLVSLAEQGKKINLMVITHIDADHIGGILAFLKENGSANESTIIQVDEVWYNAFHHIYDGNIQSEATPYIIKEIFRGSIAATSRMYESNRQNISVSQGNTLAGLLKRGGYNWNTIYNKKAVCVENGISKELTSKIQCTLLGPDKEALNKLAELWINKMNGTVKRFIVCDDDLYSEAFECGQLQMINISDEIKRKDVAYESASQRILSWKELADNWQQKD